MWLLLGWKLILIARKRVSVCHFSSVPMPVCQCVNFSVPVSVCQCANVGGLVQNVVAFGWRDNLKHLSALKENMVNYSGPVRQCAYICIYQNKSPDCSSSKGKHSSSSKEKYSSSSKEKHCSSSKEKGWIRRWLCSTATLSLQISISNHRPPQLFQQYHHINNLSSVPPQRKCQLV